MPPLAADCAPRRRACPCLTEVKALEGMLAVARRTGLGREARTRRGKMRVGSFWSGAALAAILAAGPACAASRDDNLNDPIIGEENAVLADAPNVPPPIRRDHATKVVVHLEVRELEGRLADGVRYTFWTFGGHVPGKFIRIREGDEVEMHLDNHPDNKNAAQHRPACGQRPRRRRGGVADGARPQLGVLVQGAQSGTLRLPLRDGAGGHARRQRHVRHDPGRAEGGPAEGRPRILRHAGRLLHARARTASRACSRSAWRRRSTRSRSMSCSTARSARPSATRR